MDEVAKNLKTIFLLDRLFLKKFSHNCNPVSEFLELLVALSFVCCNFCQLILRVFVVSIELLNFQK